MIRYDVRPAGSVTAWWRAARQDTPNGRLAARAFTLGRFRLFLASARRMTAARAAGLTPLLAGALALVVAELELVSLAAVDELGPARQGSRVRWATGHLEVNPSHGPPAGRGRIGGAP